MANQGWKANEVGVERSGGATRERPPPRHTEPVESGMRAYFRPCAECGTSFRSYPSQQRRFCSGSCGKRFNDKLKAVSTEERFWSKVDKSGECWIWTGCLTNRGYGNFGVRKGYNIPAHRFAYELTCGPIPEGFLACHHCDNRRCVRPDHLFLGSHRDNTQDCIRKGRFCSGDRHHKRIRQVASVATSEPPERPG